MIKGSGTLELLSLGPKRKQLEIALQAVGHRVIHSFSIVLLTACNGQELFLTVGKHIISPQNRFLSCVLRELILYFGEKNNKLQTTVWFIRGL